MIITLAVVTLLILCGGLVYWYFFADISLGWESIRPILIVCGICWTALVCLITLSFVGIQLWQISQLKKLSSTALQAEELTVSVTDLLVEEGAFAIPGIVLSYENRTIKFIPLFLYGQGVIGCVEVTLCTGNNVTRLSRLFMRAGQVSAWTLNQQRDLSRPGELFDEDAFFRLINVLLP